MIYLYTLDIYLQYRKERVGNGESIGDEDMLFLYNQVPTAVPFLFNQVHLNLDLFFLATLIARRL